MIIKNNINNKIKINIIKKIILIMLKLFSLSGLTLALIHGYQYKYLE